MAVDTEKVRRTYFDHPLVSETLRCLPGALKHHEAGPFRRYVIEHLPQNSLKGRQRIARYFLQRFSRDGRMNLPLAAAIARFRDSRTSREILYFELLQVYPLLLEISTHWLAELPPEGGARSSLVSFLAPKIPGRSVEKVAKDSLTTMKQCGKVNRPKPRWYVAAWSPPPLEAFLYVLARLCPEPAMQRVDLFTGLPVFRAMLWPSSSIEELLAEGQRAGHVSRISRLDQYHQFALAGSGKERMRRLVPNLPSPPEQARLFEPRVARE